jgi:hypothetical protein
VKLLELLFQKELQGRASFFPFCEKEIRRLTEDYRKPPCPIMTQEEFDALPHFEKVVLTCNMPGCGKPVSTHGLLCVDHLNPQLKTRVYVTSEHECRPGIKLHFDSEKWKRENPGYMEPCDPEDRRPFTQRSEEWPYIYYEIDENGKPIG